LIGVGWAVARHRRANILRHDFARRDLCLRKAVC
jgi:hypothetical protein